MTQLVRFLTAILLFGLFSTSEAWCQTQTNCPVLPSLASSKLPSPDGEHLVIWYFNQGTRITRGIQFELFMLDSVGNRYPASQRYIATGATKPQEGDVVSYSTDDEKKHFGDTWALIEGVEVRVTRVMFKDASVWVPQKGQVCKMVFMNDEYQAEMDRRRRIEMAGGRPPRFFFEILLSTFDGWPTRRFYVWGLLEMQWSARNRRAIRQQPQIQPIPAHSPDTQQFARC